jgi:hypothetical protein
MNNARFLLAAAASAWAVAAAAGQAVPFTAGNLVVVQVGDGAASLTSAAAPVFVKEIRIADGAVIQTIALPTTATTSGNRALTLSGTSTSEGFIKRSVDLGFLTLGGYNADVGTAAVAQTSAATNPRVVARLAANGSLDSSTAFDGYSGTTGSNAGFRAVITTNGNDLWTAGTFGGTVNNTTGGVRYLTFGSSTSVQVSSNLTNSRVVDIFGGQLYVSSASGALQGVSTVGSGLPTGPDTVTILPGFPTAAGPSAYDFFFADASTLYVADDRAVASGGGLQKWTFDSGANTWTLAYTLNTGITVGLRGVTGAVTGGTTTLFATTGTANGSNGNALVTVTDTGASSAFTTVLASAASSWFKGVDFAPIGGNTPPSCYANCDGSTTVPFLNVLDFNCFVNRFQQGESYANCDGSTVAPVLNVLDFNCFVNAFSAGCSAP